MPNTTPAGPFSRSALSRRGFVGALAAAALPLGARPSRASGSPEVLRTAKLSAPNIYELVVSTSADLLYVAAPGSRGQNAAKLLGLDLQSLETRSTIDLGADAMFGLGINDRTATLYGSNTLNGKVVALDLRSGTVKARIGEGEAHLREVVVDEAGNRVFAGSFGRDKGNAVWVIDGATNSIATVISDGLDGGIAGLAFDAKANRLFATALQKNEIIEIDLTQNKATRRFSSTGDGPIGLAFDPATGRLFCTDQKSGQLAVIDASDGHTIKMLDTGAGALGVTLSADGKTAFVANRGAGTVSVVDTAALSVVSSLETGTHPNTVAVDRRSGLAYASNKGATAPRGQPPVDDPRGDSVSIIRA